MRQKQVIYLFVFLFFGMCSVSHSTEGMTNSIHEWEIGDSWTVSVTLYARTWMLSFSDPQENIKKNVPNILARYTMQIQIVSIEVVDNSKCWKINFTPSKKAPKGIKEQGYSIWISQKDGSTQKVERFAGKDIGNPSLILVGTVTVLENSPYGFPLEIISSSSFNNTVLSNKGKGSMLSVDQKAENLNGEKLLQISLKKGTKELSRIKQKWTVGEKWWKEYEKYTDGHKELHASSL